MSESWQVEQLRFAIRAREKEEKMEILTDISEGCDLEKKTSVRL
jgi:hypothetical protein